MIPKIIHYCWFGRKPKPKNIEKYINGWKEKLPDYEFKEWNENNFDIENTIPYVKQAYKAKKYAFVSDYVRVYALCQYGGVYFDTDIEVVKPFDDLIVGYDAVFGFEREHSLCTAFMASIPHHPLFEEFLEEYRSRVFILEDGKMDLVSINQHLNALIRHYNINYEDEDRVQKIDQNITVYPKEYFSAFDMAYWFVDSTKNTRTIHHIASSWQGTKLKLK
ncbi:MAG: glycosyl transferase, partial [Eubacterium sp.]|nr:glycosyl transferase [Eubacterium sp.]